MRSLAAIAAWVVMCLVPSTDGDLLWDNGSFDGRNRLASFRGPGWENWTADDLIATVPIRIQEVTAEFYVDYPEGQPFELADIGVWTEPVPGEGPQDLVIELRDLAISSEKIGEGFGYDIIAATVEGLDVELEPGDYFFSTRLVDYTGTGLSYLATTGDGVLKGRDAGWCFAFHPPFWYPARDYLGYDSDFAFRLEGIPEPTTATLLLAGLILAARRR